MKLVLVFKGWLVTIGLVTFLLNPSDACDRGVVMEKIHVPAHEEVIDSYSIHMDAPMKEVLSYSESFYLMIASEGDSCQCKVSMEDYQAYQLGDTLWLQ